MAGVARSWLTALVCLAVLAPSACGGSEDAKGGGAGANDASATFAASACALCERAACSAAFADCETDPECAAYLGCEGACGIAPSGDADSACRAGCPTPQSSTGVAKLEALRACRFEGGGTSCAACGRPGADGGAGDSGKPGACIPPPVLTQTCAPSDDPSACIKCQFEKCCDSVDAVFNGGPATALKDCWLACNADPVCEDACYDQHPDGIPDFAGYEACNLVNCRGANPCKPTGGCNQCMYSLCACEYASCIMDLDCFRIFHCRNLCNPTDVACGAACEDKYPGGKQANDRLKVCVGQRCTDVCVN